MKTVDDLVSEWSQEEREAFRDLIHECREREKRLIENSRACKESLIQLTESLISLLLVSSEMKQKTEKAAGELLGLYLRLYDNKIPSS